MNPFLLTGYVSPSYFCDRVNETERLTNALINNRNVTLFSRRRIGKTALVHHTFNSLKRKKHTTLIYLDIYSTNNIKDFAEEVGRAVLGEFDSGFQKITTKLKNIFSQIRPTITYDSLTGNPVVSFDWQSEKQVEITLKSIFEYLNNQNKQIIIAFDEFQQILNYPEKNTEALLRTFFQKSPNITCVFSGSQDHLMTSMFNNKKRPFYQFGELFHLEKINTEEYLKFIRSKFTEGKKKISDESINEILTLCENHTYFVQYLCNRLYASGNIKINEGDIRDAIQVIIKENEQYYLNYRNLLTRNQWSLLSAIAKENGIAQITSSLFIKKYSLNSASSVKSALNTLVNKDLVFYEKGIYDVEDLFFKNWMQRN